MEFKRLLGLAGVSRESAALFLSTAASVQSVCLIFHLHLTVLLYFVDALTVNEEIEFQPSHSRCRWELNP